MSGAGLSRLTNVGAVFAGTYSTELMQNDSYMTE